MKVVVVGGGAAGMSAASRIKALQPQWDVKVFEETEFVSHAPCGIPYVVEGLAASSRELMYYPPEFFREKRGIDLHIKARVIETGDGFVRVRENGVERKYEWDKLVIATGALPKLPPIDGLELENVFTIRHPAQVDQLKKVVQEVKNAVIIGAGYIGIEMAEALSAIGKQVTVIEYSDQPLPNLDSEIAEVVRKKMEKKVNLRLNEKVESLDGKDRVQKVTTDREFPGVIGTQLTKFFELEIGSTGLTEKAAKSEGFDIKTAFIQAKTRVHYYPGGRDTWLKVVAEKKTNKVLGAQIAGGDVAMRVNVFAVMIHAGFTTKDVFFTDLGYAPPFTPIWDPIIVSARVLKF